MTPFEKQEIEFVNSEHPFADAAQAEQEPRPKFPRALAIEVANALQPFLCDHVASMPDNPLLGALKVVGSTRRRKPEVKDLELLFIPQIVPIPDPQSLIGDTLQVSAVNLALDRLVARGILAKRPNKNGVTAWGESIRLAIHVPTGLPVDFFACNQENWFNQLVCRTGGAQSNLAVAVSARARGLKWNPFGKGFTNVRTGKHAQTVRSEEDVFRIAGLPYLQPHQRQ